MPHRPEAAEEPMEPQDDPTSLGPHAISRRVLIIEDEPRLREMLARAVSEMDFEPRAVPSAEAAIREMTESPAGILIVDINLPGMNGLELCEVVRQRWPDTHAVILTGHGSLAAAQTAIRLDVVDFLTKPCTLGEIEVALGRALRRRIEAYERGSASGDEAGGGRLPSGGGLGEGTARDEPWDDDDQSGPMTLEEIERRHILAALERHGGNRAAAAEELGISVRTIYYRLRGYGLRQPPEPDET